MTKLLVTGGLGYLGSVLVPYLAENGFEVTVLDNLLYHQDLESIKTDSYIEVIKGDIRDEDMMMKITKGQDVVIALACIVGDQACQLKEDETISTNLEATGILMKAVEKNEVKRLLFASSCSVYGVSTAYTLNEGSHTVPLSLYAKCKLESEKIILNSYKNTVPVILRLSTLFGVSSRMRFDLALNFMVANAYYKKKIMVEGGRQWRPFLHLKDCAEAFKFFLLAEEDKVKGEIFNIGSPKNNIKIENLAEEIGKIVDGGVLIERRHRLDKRDYKIDFNKLNLGMGLTLNCSITDGINEIASVIEQYKDYEDDKYYNVKYAFKNE